MLDFDRRLFVVLVLFAIALPIRSGSASAQDVPAVRPPVVGNASSPNLSPEAAQQIVDAVAMWTIRAIPTPTPSSTPNDKVIFQTTGDFLCDYGEDLHPIAAKAKLKSQATLVAVGEPNIYVCECSAEIVGCSYEAVPLAICPQNFELASTCVRQEFALEPTRLYQRLRSASFVPAADRPLTLVEEFDCGAFCKTVSDANAVAFTPTFCFNPPLPTLRREYSCTGQRRFLPLVGVEILELKIVGAPTR